VNLSLVGVRADRKALSEEFRYFFHNLFFDIIEHILKIDKILLLKLTLMKLNFSCKLL
jgi:hypothetical protein